MEVIKQCSSSFYLHKLDDKMKKPLRNSSNKLSLAGNRQLTVSSNKISNVRIRKVLTNTSIISRKVIRHGQIKEIVTNVSPIKSKKENFFIDDEEDDIKKLVKLF